MDVCHVCGKSVPTTGDMNYEGTRAITVPDDGATWCASCDRIIHVECVSKENGALCQDCERALEREASAA